MQVEPSKDKFALTTLISFVRRPPRLARNSINQTAGFQCGRVALDLCHFRIDRLDLRGRLGISTRVDMSHTRVHKMIWRGRVRSRTRNPCELES